jgi:acetyl-CoA C-acetyltransferase
VQKIKLKSATMTRIGKHRSGYFELVREAAGRILAAADPERVGRIFFSSFAPRELCGIEDPAGELEAALRADFPGLDAPVSGPFKTGGEALYRALDVVSDGNGGEDRDTLLLACEKMTHVDAATAAGLLAPRVNPVEKLYGATLPSLGALVTRAYMRKYRVPYHAFHRVAVKNHFNAARNPNAHFTREISVAEVAASPLVADPLRRHHCAPMSDGAAACLIGTAGDGPAISGRGLGIDTTLFHERRDLGRFHAAGVAANSAFADAGVTPADIDVVEIHDAFSPFELINLEELGFFRPGTAWHALEDGELEVGARLAVNPSGGMKARGHPIGVCGLSSVVEMFEQLTGTAGARQQTGARLGAIQSAGGVSRHCYVFILGAD